MTHYIDLLWDVLWLKDIPKKKTKSTAKRKPYTRTERQMIFERDNYTCYICGCLCYPTPEDPELPEATIDHIKPKSRGGSNDPDNLRTCCRQCNRYKGNADYSTLLKETVNEQPETCFTS